MFGLNLIFLLHSGAEGLITQAREWEAKGEYNQAIACYCKVSSDMTSDVRFALIFFNSVYNACN